MVECKSRGAYLMGLTTVGNYNIEESADFTVYIPETDEHFATSLAVIPLQDYLCLGTEARINLPSTLGNNWKWRLVPGQVTDEMLEKMCHLNKLFGRL